MNVALANSILVDALMRAPDPMDLCALRQQHMGDVSDHLFRDIPGHEYFAASEQPLCGQEGA